MFFSLAIFHFEENKRKINAKISCHKLEIEDPLV